MKLVPSKHHLNKLISILLFYAMIFDLSIPCAQAINLIHSGKFDFPASKYIAESAFYKAAEVRIPEIRKEVKSDGSVDKETASKMTMVMAATGGPGQGESQSFSLNTHDGIINEFTGDLNYSLPLMDVEGFPLTLTYSPNISMDQEASWVGLGWDLSLGSINRELRGIPDDFAGDKIARIFNTNPERINGKKNGPSLAAGLGAPIGKNLKHKTEASQPSQSDQPDESNQGPTLDFGLNGNFIFGRYTSNYTGRGFTIDQTFGFNLSVAGIGGQGSLGYNIDNQNGIGVSKGIGFMAVPEIKGFSLGGYTGSLTKSTNSRSGTYTLQSASGITYGPSAYGSSYMNTGAKGSTRTFGVQTYVPRFSVNMLRSGDEAQRSYGVTFLAMPIAYINETFNTAKYNSISHLTSLDNSSYGYGYYNLSKSKNDSKAMLDFNRGKGTEIDVNSMHLNFSMPTYDVFHCNAPGLGSQYRANRYEAFKLKDQTISNTTSMSNSDKAFNAVGGIVVANPSNYMAGLDITNGHGTYSGTASTGEMNSSILGFTDPGLTFNKKEYYLKTVGELTPVNDNLFQSFQGDRATSLQIRESSDEGEIETTGSFTESVPGTGTNMPALNYDLKRPNNIVHYREYTAQELSESNNKILSFTPNDCSRIRNSSSREISIVTDNKPKHLIAAVEVVNESGMHYYFGTPAYNYKQKEVTFSASGLKSPTDYNRTGLIQYNVGDNSLDNQRGRQGLYDEVTTPSYAHSLLLNSMYSNDYVDMTNDGPTPDDQGTYYKVNYSNFYGKNGMNGDNNYFNWRFPMTGESASTAVLERNNKLAYFQENMNTDPWDDMAQYTYGEKDLWYAHSVESKNFIALFCLENRTDQFSAKGENGGLDVTKAGKLLKKIILVSKAHLQTGQAPEVFQVVEFEYDYSLCPNYAGNKNTYNGFYGANTGEGTGKLTLKKVYIYSGKSLEGKASPIEFVYKTADENPSFAFNSSDKWGTYKPNNPVLPNHLYPYAEQNITKSTKNVQAWKLDKVKLPTGGEMRLFYEPDTYSHVQDQKAMRMFNVVGMSDTESLNELDNAGNVSTVNQIYSRQARNNFRDPSEKKDHYNVVYFKLDKPITNNDKSQAALEVQKMYFTNATGEIPDEMLFSMRTILGNNSTDRYETVVSEARLSKKLNDASYIGVVGNQGPYKYGYVVLEVSEITEKSNNYYITDLQKANWEFARKMAPYTIYGEVNYEAGDPESFCKYEIGLDARVIFGGDLNKRINKKNYGIIFDTTTSFIRMFEPDGVKYGGGSRIFQITYTDNWNLLSGESSAQYDWRYIYGRAESHGEEKTTGVAAYEPVMGGEENPLYDIVGYDVKRHLLPTEKRSHIAPFTEIGYPAPVVGYGEVITRFAGQQISLSKSIGEEKTTYYTAKDYPVITRTTVDNGTPVLRINRTGKNAFKKRGRVYEKVGFSEGFVLITNDFHGKIKENTTYSANGEKISVSAYKYLNADTEKVKYLQKDGTLLESLTPREFDIYSESWQSYSKTEASNSSITQSVGAFVGGIIPIPYYKWSKSTFLSDYTSEVLGITLNKMINHSAVLSAVETMNLGNYNTAKNHLLDPVSGKVILASLQDEFNDNLYSFSYPAHWKYSNFAPMHFSDGAVISQYTATANELTWTSSPYYTLNVGDRLEIISATNVRKLAWVIKIDGNVAKLIDETGNPLAGIVWAGAKVRILNTGVKNTLSADMMKVSTKVNPLNGAGTVFTFPATKIIQSSALTFEENKNVPCTKNADINSIAKYYAGLDNAYTVGQTINPFLIGVKGNYRPAASYVYQKDRTNFADPNGIRQDGTYISYTPFYQYQAGSWKSVQELFSSDLDWRNTGNVNAYSEDGRVIQVSDPLKINSASMIGYNRLLRPGQSAVATNAKIQDFGYDGFEIYSFNGTVLTGISTPHFSLYRALMNQGGTVSTEEKHSGKTSMKVLNTTETAFVARVADPVLEENILTNKYEIKACNCIRSFEPKQSETYFVSVWVKQSDPSNAARLTVNYFNGQGATAGTSSVLAPGEEIIDGWQKIEGEFTLPATTASITIAFSTGGAAFTAYFDDFRVHPYKSAMTSTVYDEKTLLPLAEHDNSNYTIFYNYDEDNQLVRVRIETTEGIQTVSESESGIRKN